MKVTVPLGRASIRFLITELQAIQNGTDDEGLTADWFGTTESGEEVNVAFALEGTSEKRDITRFQEIAEWDWVVTSTWNVLHSIKEIDWERADEQWGGEVALLACGIRTNVVIPGIFARMGAPRCKNCCRATGFPQGIGSPKNDDQCRPLAEARIEAARRATHDTADL